ncbi:MAG: DNA methyltransferase [Ignavibacteria bacterium]|jgi:DNA modification methylase|nr:DNA methyltransferase [Ignavibacteria bacterium]
MNLFNNKELNNVPDEQLEIEQTKNGIFTALEKLLDLKDLHYIKKELLAISEFEKEHKLIDNYSFFQNDIEQIRNTQTIERTKYYIKRLIKSLKEERFSKINDLDLNKWKQYDDIITDSLWVLDKRDNSGAHNGNYWGNFIPQIPNQLFKRYTKKGEWILDTFLGSGTSIIEARRLGRNAVGIELQSEVVEIAQSNIQKEENFFNTEYKIINKDCTELNYKEELKKIGIKQVQFVIMHPPYWDIIKFSEDEKDLSNAKSLKDFLDKIGKLIDALYPILEKGRYLAFVIGDKYSNAEWIPLGFYCMNEIQKRKLKLKSIIVKNFEETKGKMKEKELWRYRALLGGFYIFKHEYILLFKKG